MSIHTHVCMSTLLPARNRIYVCIGTSESAYNIEHGFVCSFHAQVWVWCGCEQSVSGDSGTGTAGTTAGSAGMEA